MLNTSTSLPTPNGSPNRCCDRCSRARTNLLSTDSSLLLGYRNTRPIVLRNKTRFSNSSFVRLSSKKGKDARARPHGTAAGHVYVCVGQQVYSVDTFSPP